MPEYGICQQSNYSATGNYETKKIVMSTFEFGFTFDIGKRVLCILRCFSNAGMEPYSTRKNKSYVGYNATSSTNRNANGLYSTNSNAEITPAAFGLTLGLNFK